jgi:ribosomal protein S6
MSKEVNLYEIGLLVTPEIPEEKAPEVIGAVRTAIEDKGGTIESIQDLKMRRIWFPIKQMSSAYFGAVQFMIAPAKIEEIKKDAEKNNSILRHLILEWKKEPPRPIYKPLVSKDEATPETKSDIVVEQPENRSSEHPASKPRVDEEEIDKKLDEILGS